MDAPPLAPLSPSTGVPPVELSHPWSGVLGNLRVGPGTRYRWAGREGFLELPALRSSDQERPNAHGTFSEQDWASGRYLTARFIVRDRRASPAFDATVQALRGALVPGSELVTSWWNIPGIGPVRWDVRPRRVRVVTDPAFDAGVGVIEAQLYAPDPVGYGAQVSVSTGLRAQAGGMEFDLFTDGVVDTGFLEFGETGSTGRVRVVNQGTAETWPVFTVAGWAPPFQIVETATGRRLEYSGVVPAGSSLSIDSATGVVLLDEVADRSGSLVRREWAPVPAHASSEFLFLPLGPVSPTASLTVTCSPGWW